MWPGTPKPFPDPPAQPPPSNEPPVVPSVKARTNVVVEVPTNTVMYPDMAVTDFDQGTSSPQHDPDVNPSHLTAQEDGVYLLTTWALWDATVNPATFYQLGYRHNGVGFGPYDRFPLAASPDGICIHMSGQIRLSAGDYIETMVMQHTGATLNLNGLETTMTKVA